jgi:hypothetical protein
MNNLLETSDERLARRQFLQRLAAASLTTMMAGEPRLWADEELATAPEPTADACIVLWMAGGMAARNLRSQTLPSF